MIMMVKNTQKGRLSKSALSIAKNPTGSPRTKYEYANHAWYPNNFVLRSVSRSVDANPHRRIGPPFLVMAHDSAMMERGVRMRNYGNDGSVRDWNGTY